MPTGFDVINGTSHQMRSALRRSGWTMQETPTEIRLLAPGTEDKAPMVDHVLGSAEDQEEEAPSPPAFSLEAHLRDFLAANLHTISVDGRRLRLYVDAAEREGIEFPTAVGPIDILAVDDEGSFFVFELKRADSSDRVVGQLARYMGWVQQTIGKDRKVYGVIVARSVNRNLRYAASIIPSVRLFEYAVQFSLTPAHDLGVS
jgi:hypothetical protein